MKRIIITALIAFSFFLGYYAASGDPMSGTVTAIEGDTVTVTDVCGREYSFQGREDYDQGDTVAFVHHGDKVLRVRYVG